MQTLLKLRLIQNFYELFFPIFIAVIYEIDGISEEQLKVFLEVCRIFLYISLSTFVTSRYYLPYLYNKNWIWYIYIYTSRFGFIEIYVCSSICFGQYLHEVFLLGKTMSTSIACIACIDVILHFNSIDCFLKGKYKYFFRNFVMCNFQCFKEFILAMLEQDGFKKLSCYMLCLV